VKTFIAALALAALCVGCSKDDATTTPPPEATPTVATPAPEEAAAAKEVDELAKEIEADLADEG
jgi:hypothetical protein